LHYKKNVHDRFTEAQEQKQLVTRRQLQQRAIAAAVSFQNVENKNKCTIRFAASPRWLTNFIKDFKISNCRVIRHLSKKEIKSPENIIKSTISNFDPVNFNRL